MSVYNRCCILHKVDISKKQGARHSRNEASKTAPFVQLQATRMTKPFELWKAEQIKVKRVIRLPRRRVFRIGVADVAIAYRQPQVVQGVSFNRKPFVLGPYYSGCHQCTRGHVQQRHHQLRGTQEAQVQPLKVADEKGKACWRFRVVCLFFFFSDLWNLKGCNNECILFQILS